MQKTLTVLFTCLIHSYLLVAQVSINTDGTFPDNSAMLDVKAFNRGIILPRLSTATRDLIPSPETGLLIFNSTENQVNYYNGTYWVKVESEITSTSTGTLQAGGGTLISVSAFVQPKKSAMLDVDDPSRGVLIPRTTPGAILSPAEGSLIYNTSTNLLDYYNGIQWISLCVTSTGVPGATGTQPVTGVAIKTGSSAPHHSAILDISATDRGILIPRLTKAQRDEILPDVGLIIYNTQADLFEFFNGSEWRQM
ncbi:MAG: hypothetical protein JXA23_03430, partial [Bacteroidales bacterium]|nr:hypothetical protein [Bacteroidales bacterium]